MRGTVEMSAMGGWNPNHSALAVLHSRQACLPYRRSRIRGVTRRIFHDDTHILLRTAALAPS